MADIIERLIPNIESCMETLSFERSALRGAVEYLRRTDIGMPATEPANEPLSLDELLECNDESVYIWMIDAKEGRWVIRNKLCWVDACIPERMSMFNCRWYKHSEYGKTWIAYRIKPKEAEG